MRQSLQISTGAYSGKGRKAINQDFHAIAAPEEPLRETKGIAIALADGISSSDVSQTASKTAVTAFLDDYLSTPEPWSVKTAARRVLYAINSWLYSQTRNSPHRYNMDKGYVCTFSALILKSTSAHLLHVGDARIYRLLGRSMEQLTEDHRLRVSREKSYLSRALGMKENLEIDYQRLDTDIGDTFILATDGVYEFVPESFFADTILSHDSDLNHAAKLISDEALRQGSDDNISILIVRILQLPPGAIGELKQQVDLLPFPPELESRMQFDGYEILRKLHSSSRSHIYLAKEPDSEQYIAIKTPSVDLRGDDGYLERLLMEEWIARRIDNAHVLRAGAVRQKRGFLYTVMEYLDGQTLAQWMLDNPAPDIETVRGIIEQVARGLRAFHRLEMVHQDLRPNNIMIDRNGTVKIIDFGSTRVAGLAERDRPDSQSAILGTAQYTAPEYFLGETGTPRSDQFSLAVITYQMLSGRLPYGTQIAKSTTRAAQRKLNYHSVLDDKRDIPAWIDETLKKALHPDPGKRYAALSEFTHDLRHPGSAFLNKSHEPLLERNPARFWKAVSLLLFLALILLLGNHPLLVH